MMLAGFAIGCIVGSILATVAVLLAIGITSQRDDEPSFIPFAIREGYRNEDGSLTEKGKRFSDAVSPLNTRGDHYVAPANVAMHHPIGSWWPTCPDCGREASYSIKRLDSPVPIGYGCEAHGEFR